MEPTLTLKPLILSEADVLLAYPEARAPAVEDGAAPLEWYLRDAPEDISFRLSSRGGISVPNGESRSPRFLHAIDFLGFSRESGFGVIRGWVDDRSNKLAHLILRSGSTQILVAAQEITRTASANGERAIANSRTGDAGKIGFVAAFCLPHGDWRDADFRIGIVCENGECEWVAFSEQNLPAEEAYANVMEIVGAVRRAKGLKGLCAVDDPVIASLGNALLAARPPALPKPVLSDYCNGTVSTRAERQGRRRASWVLLLDESSPLVMPWVSSFARKDMREDEILLVGTQTVTEAAHATLSILTLSRCLRMSVLACPEKASKSAQLNLALDAVAGDFAIFVDQRCHLAAMPQDFLRHDGDTADKPLRAGFCGIVQEVNGTIFESGADLADMIAADSFDAFSSAWARSRAEIIAAPCLTASTPGGLCFGVPTEFARDLGAFDAHYETRWFAFADMARRMASFAGPVTVLRDFRFDDVVASNALAVPEHARMERDLVRFAARLGGVP